MSSWVSRLLFDSTPAQFDSNFSVEESVEKLRGASARWYSLSGLFNQRAVGVVFPDRVRLERVRPFIRNDFKPQFVGHFVQSDGKVFLVGAFSMRLWTKVFMTFWLGFCVLWILGATIAVFAVPASPKFLPLAGVLMFVIGSSFTLAAKSWARDDISWLKDLIGNTLSGAT
jgi:hypothetical protein